MSASTLDYGQLYDQYWVWPDRWDTHSFTDPDLLVEQIIRTCGSGTMLDVGCGMGLLVETLLESGADAFGTDIASTVIQERAKTRPDRYRIGSILDLPFEDESFQTVISTDVLEHLEEADVPRALSELHRVTRRFAFIRLATGPDGDKKWHLTMQRRRWWEQRFFEAGFRKNPLYQLAVPYEALEKDGFQITIPLEKIPVDALKRYPLDALQAERNLHMDMLRETGRRSDAHIARYTLARNLVRPGDLVLDAACGLGYGSAILAAENGADCVLGVDSSQYAVEYGLLHFADYGCEFQLSDATELAWLGDESVDVIVSFETLEHLAAPERFLEQLHRVLRPGGRAIFSVPNDWTDETGQDPSPYHLHAYDWTKLHAQLQKHFRVDQAYAQTAGAGMKLSDRPRRLVPVPFSDIPSTEAEWWLATVTKL